MFTHESEQPFILLVNATEGAGDVALGRKVQKMSLLATTKLFNNWPEFVESGPGLSCNKTRKRPLQAALKSL